MKKHELLTKAMQEYPIGSTAIFKTAPNVKHVSDGIFKVNKWWDEDIKKNVIVINDGSGRNCFYDNGEWAEIVPDKKPTEITIELDNGREATIFKVGQVNFSHPRSFMTAKDIEDISHALKQLQS